jgi:ribosome maturation factor RimP
MEDASLAEQLELLIEPVASQHGLELVAVETVGSSGNPIVRVFLDREGGIGLDVIAKASTWVSETLEAADPIDGKYTLEVSSPGIDRPLRKLEDYERFMGQTAVLKTRPIEGRSSFTGRIVGVAGETIEIDVDGDPVAIPVNVIKKAHLKGEVDFGTEDKE